MSQSLPECKVLAAGLRGSAPSNTSVHTLIQLRSVDTSGHIYSDSRKLIQKVRWKPVLHLFERRADRLIHGSFQARQYKLVQVSVVQRTALFSRNHAPDQFAPLVPQPQHVSNQPLAITQITVAMQQYFT